MLSEKTRSTVSACRFCWMCRHLCPVGLATGSESHNPRAKALFISLAEKGVNLEAETAAEMYECALCNACAANCETGYEPALFIREMRAVLAADGLAPEKIAALTDALLTNGTLYGKPAAQMLAPFDEITNSLPAKADVLLFAGAAAAGRAPEELRAFMRLLEKAGVVFSILRSNDSSGAAEYDLLGDIAEVREVCERCADAINASGAKRVIALDPSDAVMFKQRYAAWGIDLKAEPVTATAFLAALVRAGALHLEKRAGTVAFHDPCRLARDLEETQPARELLREAGYELREMLQSKKLTRCCGGEILPVHSPEIAEKMAENRIADAVRTGADMLVTACPGCMGNLSGATKIKVCGLFSLLNGQIK